MTRKAAAALVTAGAASLKNKYYPAQAKQQLFDLQDGTVSGPAVAWAQNPGSEWQLLCASLPMDGGFTSSVLSGMRDMYDGLASELKLKYRHPLRFAAAEDSAYRQLIADLPHGWTRSLAMMESLYDAQPAAVRSQYKHALLWAAAPASAYRRAIAELPTGWYKSIKVMVELYDAEPAAVRSQYKHALLWAAAEGGGRSVFAEHCARARRAANDARIHARSVVTAARLAARAAAHREDVEETLQRDRDGGIDIASWHTGGAFRSEFF